MALTCWASTLNTPLQGEGCWRLAALTHSSASASLQEPHPELRPATLPPLSESECQEPSAPLLQASHMGRSQASQSGHSRLEARSRGFLFLPCRPLSQRWSHWQWDEYATSNQAPLRVFPMTHFPLCSLYFFSKSASYCWLFIHQFIHRSFFFFKYPKGLYHSWDALSHQGLD